MDHGRTVSQQLAPSVPLLRLPLLLTGVVSAVLSWISASCAYGCYYPNQLAFFSLAITFSVSLIQNLLLLTRFFVIRKIKLAEDEKTKKLTLFIGIWDSTFALAFLVQHIIVLATVSSGAYYSIGIRVYAGIGALISCALYTVLAAVPIHAWYVANRQARVRCPTCHQKMKRGAVVPSPVSPVRQSPRAEASTMANEDGMTEGDRLITPGADE